MDVVFKKEETQEMPVTTTEPIAPVIETPANPIEQVTTPVINTPVDVPEYFKKIEEISGKKFTKDEELKSFFEEHDKIKTEFSSFKEKQDYYTELENEIIEKGKDYDPVAKLGGKENYKKAVIIQELAKNGDEGIAKKFVMSDRSKMDSLEILSLYAEYQAPILVGDTDAATRAALRQLGIVIDKEDDLKEKISELDKESRALIDIKAREIRTAIDKAIDSVPEPEIKDPIKDIFNKTEQRKSKIQEYSTKWSQAKNQVIGELDTIEFKNSDFKFQINKEAVEDVVTDFLNGAAREGIEPDKDGMSRVVQAIKNSIWDKNRDKILEAKQSYDEAKWKEEYEKKHTNAAPLTVNQPPPVDDRRNQFMASVEEATGVKRKN